MRTRPTAVNGAARLEEIRAILGMTAGEFSLAMGFKSEGGYSATLRGNVSVSHVLTGEGLLALKKPNGHARPNKMVLLEINENSEVSKVIPLVDAQEMLLNGAKFLVLKQGDSK